MYYVFIACCIIHLWMYEDIHTCMYIHILIHISLQSTYIQNILYEKPRTDWKMYRSVEECDFYDSCGKLFRSFYICIVHLLDKSQWKFSSFSSLFFTFFLFLLFRSRHRSIVEMKENLLYMFKNVMKILKSMRLLWVTKCVFPNGLPNERQKNNYFFPHHLISN